MPARICLGTLADGTERGKWNTTHAKCGKGFVLKLRAERRLYRAAVCPDMMDPLIGKKDLITLGDLSPNFPTAHTCVTINTIKADTTPPPDVETPPPLSSKQATEIEKAISKIEGEAKSKVERIRCFLTGAADVMVSSLGDETGSISGGAMKMT
jgi:hypothetical protein